MDFGEQTEEYNQRMYEEYFATKTISLKEYKRLLETEKELHFLTEHLYYKHGIDVNFILEQFYEKQ